MLLDLPAGPGSMDNGGPVLVGPDNNIYSTIGHVQDDNDIGHETKAKILRTVLMRTEQVVYIELHRTVVMLILEYSDQQNRWLRIMHME